jgi:hypothetical protein
VWKSGASAPRKPSAISNDYVGAALRPVQAARKFLAAFAFSAKKIGVLPCHPEARSLRRRTNALPAIDPNSVIPSEVEGPLSLLSFRLSPCHSECSEEPASRPTRAKT